MELLITKDAATVVSRQVADIDEAKRIAENGFHVVVITEGGNVPLDEYIARQAPVEPAATEPAAIETVTYPGGAQATGVAPLPDESPAADPPATE